MSIFLSLLGKLLGGVTTIFGGPLKLLFQFLIERIIVVIVDKLREWKEDREAKAKIESERVKAVAEYKAAIIKAMTPEEKEKAFHDYQKALNNLPY